MATSLDHDIHLALSKPSLFDKVRDRAGTEADAAATRGKGYVIDKALKAIEPKSSVKLGEAFTSLFTRMDKNAGFISDAYGAVKSAPKALSSGVRALGTEGRGHLNEAAGLGVLMAPSVDTAQASLRAHMAGDKSDGATSKRQLLGEGGHAAIELGGLGMLTRPELGHLRIKHASPFVESSYGGNVAQNPPGMRSHSQLPGFVVPALAVKKTAGIGVGAGMSTSQYSGRLTDGRFKLTSGAPPFTAPALAEKQANSFLSHTIELLKSAAPGMNTATDAMQAAGRLHATQRVGAPRTTAPPGPSIAQIAKPKGYGTPIAGAKKTVM